RPELAGADDALAQRRHARGSHRVGVDGSVQAETDAEVLRHFPIVLADQRAEVVLAPAVPALVAEPLEGVETVADREVERRRRRRVAGRLIADEDRLAQYGSPPSAGPQTSVVLC